MNVRTLIQQLSEMPSDAEVIFPGRFGGYEDIQHVSLAEGSDEPVEVVLS